MYIWYTQKQPVGVFEAVLYSDTLYKKKGFKKKKSKQRQVSWDSILGTLFPWPCPYRHIKDCHQTETAEGGGVCVHGFKTCQSF